MWRVSHFFDSVLMVRFYLPEILFTSRAFIFCSLPSSLLLSYSSNFLPALSWIDHFSVCSLILFVPFLFLFIQSCFLSFFLDVVELDVLCFSISIHLPVHVAPCVCACSNYFNTSTPVFLVFVFCRLYSVRRSPEFCRFTSSHSLFSLSGFQHFLQT